MLWNILKVPFDAAFREGHPLQWFDWLPYYLDDDAMMVDLGVIVHVASRVYPAFDYGEFAGNCGPLNSFWYDHWAAVRLLGAAEPRE